MRGCDILGFRLAKWDRSRRPSDPSRSGQMPPSLTIFSYYDLNSLLQNNNKYKSSYFPLQKVLYWKYNKFTFKFCKGSRN